MKFWILWNRYLNEKKQFYLLACFNKNIYTYIVNLIDIVYLTMLIDTVAINFYYYIIYIILSKGLL